MKVNIPALSLQRTEGPGRGTRCSCSRKCVPASKSDSRVGASFFFACFAGSEGQPRSNYGENLRRRAPLRVI
jgi:hypothetical protein